MYTTGSIKELYRDILKSHLSVYDSVIEWCANSEQITFLSFTLTVNNLNIAMQQASSWQGKFANLPRDKEVSYLEGQCDRKSKLADELLGRIGDERNYTLHKNGDNEEGSEIIRRAMLELDGKLRTLARPKEE